MPLNRVPDPVFSSGTLGEGIAIDPLQRLPARALRRAGQPPGANPPRAQPARRQRCRAAAARRPRYRTAARRRLRGAGRGRCAGDRGQPLLRFDLDRVARGSRSLITVMILTNGDGFGTPADHQPGGGRRAAPATGVRRRPSNVRPIPRLAKAPRSARSAGGRGSPIMAVCTHARQRCYGRPRRAFPARPNCTSPGRWPASTAWSASWAWGSPNRTR